MLPQKEFGHRFLGAMRTQGLGLKLDRSELSVNNAVAKTLFLASNPWLLSECSGVFMGGPVYKSVTQKGNRTVFSELDPWRDIVGRAIREAGCTPLDGLDMNLHRQDPAAGAGRAFLAIMASPIHIVDGRTRMGPATVDEAKSALNLGHNVGLLLRPKDYDQVRKFLEGRRMDPPASLPAYAPQLDLQVADLIRGVDAIPDWVQTQKRALNPRNFKDRSLNFGQLGLINHYIFNYSHRSDADNKQFETVTQPFT